MRIKFNRSSNHPWNQKEEFLGMAPYKPIMMLAVIESIERKENMGNYIPLSELLESKFHEICLALSIDSKGSNFILPFFRIANDNPTCWTLIRNDRNSAHDDTIPRGLQKLRDTYSGLELSDQLWRRARDENERIELVYELLFDYFNSEKIYSIVMNKLFGKREKKDNVSGLGLRYQVEKQQEKRAEIRMNEAMAQIQSERDLDLLYVGTSVWDIIMGNAEKYLENKQIFHSQRRKVPYSVSEVNFDFIKIKRISARDDVVVSRKMFIEKANFVQESGETSDSEISSTTAIKTTIIELHPYLSYLDDNSVRYFRRGTSANSTIDTLLTKTENKETFDISSIHEARERIIKAINIRRGQGKFRRELLNAYKNQCCITGCEIKEVIEAAHIIPYQGNSTNDVRNGLILRADIHTLFDRSLVWINPDSFSVCIAPELLDSKYAQYAGLKISLPDDEHKWPSKDALIFHHEMCEPSFD